jgi:hypothetical protein
MDIPSYAYNCTIIEPGEDISELYCAYANYLADGGEYRDDVGTTVILPG